MRIFYAAPNTAHQTCLPQSTLWHANLYLPLVDLGHELVVFNYDYTQANFHLDDSVEEHRAFIKRNKPIFGEELLKQVRTAHREKSIDLFFSYFYSSYVDPDAILQIGKLGITTVNWYCNASYQFHLIQELAPAYHYCLVPEKFRMEDYRRVGANPIYCQEAANPNIYKPYKTPLEFDATFVGQKYGTRPLYLRYLLDHGIDVRVWGPLWRDAARDRSVRSVLGQAAERFLAGQRPLFWKEFPRERCGPPLTDEELIQMYSRSKVSLGFSVVAEAFSRRKPVKQVRLRDFEAPMSGAFYLVEFFEELTEFFEPGREIVCFTDPEELLAKTRYYLTHDSERERIRQAGYERCRRDHTWHKRFQAAFREMGLS